MSTKTTPTTQAAHTPGPWITSDNALDAPGTILDAARGARVGRSAIAQLVTGYTPAEAEANARLIASAPDLLAALRDVLEMTSAALCLINTPHPAFATVKGCHVAARAAIAKAEGRA